MLLNVFNTWLFFWVACVQECLPALGASRPDDLCSLVFDKCKSSWQLRFTSTITVSLLFCFVFFVYLFVFMLLCPDISTSIDGGCRWRLGTKPLLTYLGTMPPSPPRGMEFRERPSGLIRASRWKGALSNCLPLRRRGSRPRGGKHIKRGRYWSSFWVSSAGQHSSWD